MTQKKTEEELLAEFEAAAQDLSQWTRRDATELRAISDAVESGASAAELAATIRAAREAGHKWDVIHIAIDVAEKMVAKRRTTPSEEPHSNTRKARKSTPSAA